MKKYNKSEKNNSSNSRKSLKLSTLGFTLVELLAVIVILAIILVIAVPKIMSVIEDAKMATLESTVKMIANQAEKQKIQNAVLGKTEEVTVNTSHHQAVKEVAKGFKVTAKAPDGTIEAMENEDASVLCVQWHPERLQDMEMYQRLLKDFINRCR